MQQGSIAFLACKRIVPGYDLTAEHDKIDGTIGGHAVIRRIAAGCMQRIPAKGVCFRRIDEDDVGITARHESPFLRVESEYFCRISTGSLYESFQ